ncbi:MAG: deoxyribodipyrimidine photo-lyase [Aureispira sp.]|nr:deoxyribodipyrimidine photo-lyase [Aureispira sp.]
MQEVCVFWFRRDLRLQDNAGLYHALRSGYPVLPLFIFDQNILEDLEDKADPRVNFIHQTIQSLQDSLKALNSNLLVHYGKPEEIWAQLIQEFNIKVVFTNKDYESYAQKRDSKVKKILSEENISLKTYKDHVIFEHLEITKKDGKPYTVFTPYSKKWLSKLASRIENGISFYLKPYPSEKYFQNFYKYKAPKIPSLKDLGFEETTITIPSQEVPKKRIKSYDQHRDYPSVDGTSRLGIHFRFGTISIRQKALKAQKLNATYLNELIWRDFYSMILSNFPHVELYPFRKKYDNIPWRNNEQEFKLWCKGKTGYPIVDAGMRELNTTGHMHNRVRMITASFLTKHLLIDWRWGEAYFAQKLLDFDLASNNGGWQWAAGCGTDAAPYFRIFNPTAQQKKFDKDYLYIKKWVPEFGTSKYPMPIVDHKEARTRCLATYKAALNTDN